jgi:predicted nucleotidyltransferase component of viral defense system
MLRPETLALFQTLSDAAELDDLTLMGGTALALQIGHRFSLDLDFASYQETLPVRQLDTLVSRLKSERHTIKLITDASAISQFKINTGENLLNHVRDYVMDNVKVTFFIQGHTRKQRDYFTQADKITLQTPGFSLLGLDGLKASKTLVLADRVRSRDLFDLMVLMQHHAYDIQAAMSIIESLGHNDDPEYYKAVMTGSIPLDKADEGLDAVDITVTSDDLHAFFCERIAEYEIKLAENFFSNKKGGD